tara:strand:- start:307 stop:1128 length:822 start_codon:yes stop_codon:yes gene_type:complete
MLRKILKFFGYVLINLEPRKKHTTFEIIKFLLKKFNSKKLTIFDVGGHTGDYSKKIELILSSIIKENSRKKFQSIEREKEGPFDYEFYIFEPNEDIIENIKDKNIKNSKIYQIGIGNKVEKKNFFKHQSVTMNSHRSSFLKTGPEFFNRYKKYPIEEVSCDIDTLDNFVQTNNIEYIHFLKIDTQGYNEEVIEGAKKLIEQNKIGIIYSELILGKLYSKEETFYNFEKYLKDNYILYGIDHGDYHIQVRSRRYSNDFNIDVFYLNKKLLNNLN